MRRLTRTQIGIALLLIVVATGAWKCGDKPAERRLLEAEDTAAEVIGKLERVRTDLLNTPQPIGIDQSTATAIDRWLLRINTNVKRISVAGDRYAANPDVGIGDVTAAIAEGRKTLEDMKASVLDGSLGIKNASSQQSVVSLITSLQSVLRTIEVAVGDISRKRGS